MAGRLPSGFQEVTYIESSGTQYIDTAASLPGGFALETKTTIVGAAGTDDGFFGSYGASGSYNRNLFSFYINGPSFLLGAGSNTGYYLAGSWKYKKQYTIDCCNITSHEYLKVNGETQTLSLTGSVGDKCSLSLFLLGVNANGSSFTGKYYRLYYAYIYSDYAKTTPVRKFVPCYCTTTVTGYKGSTAVSCSSGTIGLYDLINSRFYINSGSGTFTKGADTKNSYTKIGGIGYPIIGGKAKIGGTTYSITGGKTLIAGTSKTISIPHPMPKKYLFSNGVPQFTYTTGTYYTNAASNQQSGYYNLHSYRASMGLTQPVDYTNYSKLTVILDTVSRANTNYSTQIFEIFSATPYHSQYGNMSSSGSSLFYSTHNVTGTNYAFEFDISHITGNAYFTAMCDDDRCNAYMHIKQVYLE